jgi:hypothetical protein
MTFINAIEAMETTIDIMETAKYAMKNTIAAMETIIYVYWYY